MQNPTPQIKKEWNSVANWNGGQDQNHQNGGGNTNQKWAGWEGWEDYEDNHDYSKDEPTMKQVFNQHNTENNGRVSVYKFPAMVVQFCQLGRYQVPKPQDVEHMVKESDTNQDHCMSYEDFGWMLYYMGIEEVAGNTAQPQPF